MTLLLPRSSVVRRVSPLASSLAVCPLISHACATASTASASSVLQSGTGVLLDLYCAATADSFFFEVHSIVAQPARRSERQRHNCCVWTGVISPLLLRFTFASHPGSHSACGWCLVAHVSSSRQSNSWISTVTSAKQRSGYVERFLELRPSVFSRIPHPYSQRSFRRRSLAC